MKKYLMIPFTIMVLLLSACNRGVVDTQDVQPAGPSYSVQIELECVENLLFSKYDIDVYVDDNNVGKLDHGATRTYPLELEEGSHTLRVTKENSKSVDGTIDFEVSDNITLKYKLACTSDQVKIEAIEDNEVIEDHASTENSDIDANNSEISVRTVSGFDQSTNQTIGFGGMTFSFPSYFDELYHEDSSDTRMHYYPSEENTHCSLIFTAIDTSLSQEDFNSKKAEIASNILNNEENAKDIKSEAVTIAGLSGWRMSYSCPIPTDPSTTYVVNLCFVFNPENQKIIQILNVFDSDDTTNYDYVGDYNKIIQAATISTEPSELNPQDPTPPVDNELNNQPSQEETDKKDELREHEAKRAFEYYGEYMYPYGFECHWFTKLYENTQLDDGSWKFKVGVTITNQYGASREAVAEALINNTTQRVEDFDVYVE